MAAPKTIHIIPDGSGVWVVRAASGRVGKTFATEAEAVSAAQAAVRDAGGQLQVHGAEGPPKRSFTLGRAAMAKLNAVEGVSLTPSGESAFKAFDREGLTPPQRRAALRQKIAKLARTAKAKKGASGGRTTSPKG